MAKKRKKKGSAFKRYLIGYALLFGVMTGVMFWIWRNVLTPPQKKQLATHLNRLNVFRNQNEADSIDSDQFYTYGGFPARTTYPNSIRILNNDGFVVGYDETRKNPAWVSYRLFPVDNPKKHPRPSHFNIDIRTQSKVNSNWYTRSGFDRGHLAPNYGISICYGPEAQKQTFLMSNICPQEPKLNRGLWKSLEMKTIDQYTREFGNIWITTGPIYDSKREHLKSKLEIPDGFFKILVDERRGKPRAMAIIVNESPSGSISLRQCLVSIDKVESASGLDFLRDLDDHLESNLEMSRLNNLW
ncbi:MAG TPA: DNA/RNA non-specific endonuclease [Verrucomicrobiales bacterium]|nr:DNA/RNA non-specific endonuclease [Verrucomicrobiales bacterium]HIL68784.1 DNA/RNA non-specific endonuclease [Verrucomicrobiota bacterium]